MITRLRDGPGACCRPDDKVSLGFVEGSNNEIRVLQRRAYGLRDDEYLRLKVLTCMLPKLLSENSRNLRTRFPDDPALYYITTIPSNQVHSSLRFLLDDK